MNKKQRKQKTKAAKSKSKTYWTTKRLLMWACLYLGAACVSLSSYKERNINTLAEEQYHPAITKVSALSGGHGTGFFVKGKKHTYLITASHVCAGNPILFSIWGVHMIKAIDVSYEICILEASDTMSTVELKPEGPTLNRDVSIIGFPLNYSWRKTTGTVTRLDLTTFAVPKTLQILFGMFPVEACPENGVEYKKGCLIFYNGFETSAEVLPGNSGGPVFQRRWGFGRQQVVGLVIAFNNFSRKGYFVSSEDILRVMEKNNL